MATDLRTKRLHAELKAMIATPASEGFWARPISEDDLSQWVAKINGPKETPYEGGTFKLKISFPSEYPFQPPKVQFTTRVYHMNISSKGYVCLNILKQIEGGWLSGMTLRNVLISIRALMGTPNPDDALVESIAQQFLQEREKYERVVRKWVDKYAKNED